MAHLNRTYNAESQARFNDDTGKAVQNRNDNNPNTSFEHYVESKDAHIIRLMTTILNNHSTMMTCLDRIEKDIQDLRATQKKNSAEIFRIAHRTSAIKDLTTHVAAHTLNTSRKVHGATSVLNPVKQFKEGGYKDWTIRPNATQMPFIPHAAGPMTLPHPPLFQPTMPNNPFTPYGNFTNGQNWEMNNTSGFAPRTPLDNYPEITNESNRTPVFGTRTPVYDPDEIRESFPTGNYRNPRFEPYKNKKAPKQTFSNSAKRSPYQPTTPKYD